MRVTRTSPPFSVLHLAASNKRVLVYVVNFQIPLAVWSIGPRSFTVEQFENCWNYLIKAIENTPYNETDGVPPLLRYVLIVTPRQY